MPYAGHPTKTHIVPDHDPPGREEGSYRLQDTVRLSASGLAKVLGDLEARVMQVAWDLGAPATARAVHGRVIQDHPVAIYTVITVLNKLVEKGLLRREKRDERCWSWGGETGEGSALVFAIPGGLVLAAPALAAKQEGAGGPGEERHHHSHPH